MFMLMVQYLLQRTNGRLINEAKYLCKSKRGRGYFLGGHSDNYLETCTLTKHYLLSSSASLCFFLLNESYEINGVIHSVDTVKCHRVSHIVQCAKTSSWQIDTTYTVPDYAAYSSSISRCTKAYYTVISNFSISCKQ